jgi:Ca-activated chloride channel family protein
MAQAQPSDASQDPDRRKLEQVESVRDPSRLLRAQMMLQAQEQGAPNNQSKKW